MATNDYEQEATDETEQNMSDQIELNEKKEEKETEKEVSMQRRKTYPFGKNPYKDNPEWWTKDSMLIGVHVWIYRIRKIDVINENFIAEIRLCLSWEGTEKDFNEYKEFRESENLDQDLFKHRSNNGYDPYNDCVFGNGIIEEATKIDSGCLRVGTLGTNGQEIKKTLWPYENFVVYKLSGEFFEKFELENFPMDCQDLQINIQAKRRKNVINWCPFSGVFDFPSGINIGESNLTEYNCGSMKYEIYDQNFDGQLAVYNFITFRVKIQRKAGVYFSKIVFLMFLTTIAAFLVFTMGDDDLVDKYAMLVTLLLAAVAVQFVVGTYVPNLPYLTWLDYYVVCSFALIFFVGFLVSIEAIIPMGETGTLVIAIIAITVFVAIQIIFAIWALYAKRREDRKLTMDRWDFVEFGYESDNVTIMSNDQISIDRYTKEMISKYEWASNEECKKLNIIERKDLI